MYILIFNFLSMYTHIFRKFTLHIIEICVPLDLENIYLIFDFDNGRCVKIIDNRW